MNYYVIPDIHGMNDLLQKALGEIYRREPDGCNVIFLGDYIDRGPDNVEVLNTVMYSPEGYDFVCLMGNHERMFLDAHLGKHPFYEPGVRDEIATEGGAYYRDIIEWMNMLPMTFIKDKNIFAHAYYDLTVPENMQNPSAVLWARYSDAEPFGDGSMYLTHGHTPRKHGPLKAMYRCNLDTGAVFYGRMVIARFEDGKMGPQEFIEIE